MKLKILVMWIHQTIKEKINAKNPVVFDMIPLTLEEIFIYEMEGMGYDFKGLD